jgi:ribosome recycling factor
VKPVYDSLIKSNLNLNPQIDKTTVYLNIPKVTREHRENMAKSVKLKCEQALKRMREIENKALRTIKETKRANKDQQYNVSEHVI